MIFSEDFNNIIQSLQVFQNHLDRELTAINSRLSYVEDKVNELDQRQSKDDTFFRSLEALVQTRNR